MWLYGQQPIKVDYRPPKFGRDRYCGSVDIMNLVCHTILQMISNVHVALYAGAHQVRLLSCQVWWL